MLMSMPLIVNCTAWLLAVLTFQSEGSLWKGQSLQPGNCYSMAVTGDETDTGSTCDFAVHKMHNSSPCLPDELAHDGIHNFQRPAEDAMLKRELRLMKNREAARECRRKKKEYVRCLENRVAVLENQNKTLIEELRALKDIYQHKAE